MTVLALESKLGQPLELDLCFACHGIWVDGSESQQLAPQSVLTLFRALHAHKDEPTQALKARMHCARCSTELARGSDRTRSGEYVVYRCANRHGRFGTFSSFMVEKGFVRHLNPLEVKALAATVKQIQCSSCGASVDLRNADHCGHCGAAFALLDPAAVAEALAHFAKLADQRAAGTTTAQALAGKAPLNQPAAELRAQILIEHERERERARRESREDVVANTTLWEIGLDLVLHLIRRW